MSYDELAKRLTEQRNRIYEELKGITDAAAAEDRNLSADEAARFDKGSKDMTELRERIDQIVSVETMNREAEENLRKLVPPGAEEKRREEDAAGDLTAAIRAVFHGERRDFEIPVSAKAWEKRALVTSVATGAGDLRPTTMYDRIVYHMVQTSGVLQAGPTIITTSGGETLDVPTTTSYGSAAAQSENTAFSGGSDPAIDKRSLGAYKYGQLVEVSRELIDDSAFDVVGFVARAAGIAVGLKLGTDLVTGSGSSKPAGIVTGASSGKTGATGAAGAFTADDLIDLFFSVTAPYRNSPSAAWLCKDATLGEIRKLKDGADRYLFTPASTVGAPDTLLGKPIYTDPNVASVGTGAKSVLFGDISAYFVRYAGGVRFERSDEYGFNKDVATFRSVVRADAVMVDQTGAVKYFIGAAS